MTKFPNYTPEQEVDLLAIGCLGVIVLIAASWFGFLVWAGVTLVRWITSLS